MRKPKTPLAAWIIEHRKAQDPVATEGQGWKTGELARRLGVGDSTVRGWESGRNVGEENLDALERLFRLQAPGRDAATPDQAALIAAVNRQAAATEALVAVLAVREGISPSALPPGVRELADRLIGEARAVAEEQGPADIRRAGGA